MKVLIVTDCIVNFGGVEGAQHVDAGSTQEVDADTARTLCVSCSRALYVDKKDDPTKGQRTATREDVAAVKKAVEVAEKAAA